MHRHQRMAQAQSGHNHAHSLKVNQSEAASSELLNNSMYNIKNQTLTKNKSIHQETTKNAFGLRRSETGEEIRLQTPNVLNDTNMMSHKRQMLKPGHSVGASARSVSNASLVALTKSGKNILDQNISSKGRGADIGNGYVIGYKELMSLSRLRKAGVDTEALFEEPKIPNPAQWTLGQ